MPIEEKAHTGVKDLWGVVKKSPALLITGIAGAVVVGYILIQKQGATVPSTAVPDGTTLAATTTPGGYYQPQIPYIQPVIITNNPPSVAPTPPTVPSLPTTPATGATIPSTNIFDDIVRTRYGNPVVKSYDTSHPQGIPIRSAPTATNNDITSYAGYGSKLQITGPAVSGTSNLGGTSGTNFWYPVAGGGYVSAFDVQSAYPAATTQATVPSNN